VAEENYMVSLIFLFANLRLIRSKRMGWLGPVTRTGKMIHSYNILVRKAETKRRLET
jgi:hypothetical protein